MLEEIYPKSKLTSKKAVEERLTVLKLYEGENAGLKAFGVEENEHEYIITTVWRVILPDGTKTQEDGTLQWRQ